MRKLSEFHNQQHITSVLRAMVMKKQINPKIAILGSEELASDIAISFIYSLNCENPQRGDACLECASCNLPYDISTYPIFNDAPFYRAERVIDADPKVNPVPHVIYFAFGFLTDGFLAFELKESAGSHIDKTTLIHLIHSFQGNKSLALSQAKIIGKETSFKQFLESYLEIFKNILYLRHGLEIAETEKLEALTQLAHRLSLNTISACMRTLWDSQNKTTLDDPLSIEIVASLISETISPSPETFIVEDGLGNPITQVEVTTEQPLDFERMLAIARE